MENANLLSGKDVAVIEGSNDISGNEIRFSSSGKYLGSQSDRRVALIETASGRRIDARELETRERLEAVGSSGQFVVLSSAKGLEIWTPSKHGTRILRPGFGTEFVVFSTDDRYLAVASYEGRLLVFRTGDGKLMSDIHHGSRFTDVVFSPDSEYVATAGLDGVAKVWAVLTGQAVFQRRHNGPIYGIGFSHDGRYFATAADDGTASLGLWQPRDLVAIACGTITRNLTEAEWADYMGARQYKDTCPGRGLPRSEQSAGIEISEFSHALRVVLEHEKNYDRKQSIKELAEQAKQAARDGDYQGTLVRTDEIVELMNRLDPKPAGLPAVDPEQDPRRWALGLVLEPAMMLGRAGQVRQMLEELDKFSRAHPTVEIDFSVWNEVCWNGALRGRASDVLAACDTAVEKSPAGQRANVRDSRGVARALTGDLAGAAEDFNYFIEERKKGNTNGEALRRREAWVSELRAGRNPINSSTIELLRKESVQP